MLSNAQETPDDGSELDFLEELFQYVKDRREWREAPHRHTCPKCAHTWTHRASDFNSEAEYDEGHTCSNCRTPDVRERQEI